jgi:uncharacterized protein YqjF (DUF2071 family)
VFAHWRVPAEAVQELLPDGLTVDVHDGSAWLGVNAFRVESVRLHGALPVPWISSFPQLNVRTYVTYKRKPGLWFFSLETTSRSAVETARLIYRLPWNQSRITIAEREGRFEYSSARAEGTAFSARVSPRGHAEEPEPGTLEHFLVERYCIYGVDGRSLVRAELHHRPWQLQQAAGAVDLNTVAPAGLVLDEPPVLATARLQDTLAWAPERV